MRITAQIRHKGVNMDAFVEKLLRSTNKRRKQSTFQVGSFVSRKLSRSFELLPSQIERELQDR